ncbi:putative Ig domain-containing protein [Pseudoalteromonas viridis]|uniref:Cadherin domain-containing protein n=1 Tax=Pseudoalteromonas viridis TaxID=339617 RepID=A0ABX7V6R0_9GAMM|nr:putative Ig domain-containing protein [Pseudoalteromonas viridis]QTL36569.1 hypothetical protein J5X90_05890 [Pseudoalteromonas viridis]
MNKPAYLLLLPQIFLFGCGGSDSTEVETASQTASQTEIADSSSQPSFKVKTAFTLETNEDEGINFDISANEIPEGSNAVDYEILTTPKTGEISGKYPALTFVPTSNAHGEDSFKIQLKKGDAKSEEILVSVKITPVNDKPSIVSDPSNGVVKIGSEFNFSPAVEDVDGLSAHTYTIKNQPEWSEFNASSGELSGTPKTKEAKGLYENIVITLVDGEHSIELAPFSINVLGDPWQEVTQLPGSYSSHLRAQTVGDSIYTLSHENNVASSMGCASAEALQPALHQYNTKADSWSKHTSPNATRYHYHSESVGDKILLFGGTQTCSSGSALLDTIEIYDSAAHSWTIAAAPQFGPFENNVVASCSSANALFVFSKQNSNLVLNTYNLDQKIWESKNVDGSYQNINSCSYNDEKLYLSGNNTESEKVEVFQYSFTDNSMLLIESFSNELYGPFYKMHGQGKFLYFHSAKSLAQLNTENLSWTNLTPNQLATEVQGEDIYYLRDFTINTVNGKQYQIGGRFTTQSINKVFEYDITQELP